MSAAPGQHVMLVNRSDQPLQLNQIHALSPEQRYWSEFCVYLDDFSTYPNPDSATGRSPGQKTPGKGEVGCTHREAGQQYRPLQWDGYRSALLVPAGSSLYLGAHTALPPSDPNYRYRMAPHEFIVSARTAARGISAYRSPKLDTVIRCNGTRQFNPRTPWLNTSTKDQYLSGATLYAYSPNLGGSVDEACLFILDKSGSVRWRYCGDNVHHEGRLIPSGVNRSGRVAFPSEVVRPGEAIVAQASHQCDSGSWDHAAYMYVSEDAPLSAGPVSKLVYEPRGRTAVENCFPATGGNIARQVITYKEVYNHATADLARLRAYVYFPPNFDNSRSYPVLAIFHGGGWAAGTPMDWDAIANYFASRGLVVAAFQYRLQFVHKTPGLRHTPRGNHALVPVEDARSAIRWLRKYSATLRIDPQAIIAAGDSAGGHLALATALSATVSGEAPTDAAYSSVPNAILAAYPIVNLGGDALAPGCSLWRMERSAEVSPYPLIERASTSLPPTLLLQGGADRHPCTPPDAAAAFCERSRNCTYVTAPFTSLGHGFIHTSSTALAIADAYLIRQGYLGGDPSQVPRWIEAAAPHCHFSRTRVESLKQTYGLSDYGGEW